jgi:hypothetical protein
MKIRLRVIEPVDRRSWQEPYVLVSDSRGDAPFSMAILEVLSPYGDSRDPGAWDQVEVVYD